MWLTMNYIIQLLTLLAITAAALADDEIVAELGKTTKLSSNLSLSEGEKVASVQWLKGTRTIVRSALDQVTYIETRALLDSDYSLRLQDLEFDDSGEYTLRVISTKDGYVIKRSLNVLASPNLEAQELPVLINDLNKPQDVAECSATAGSAPFSIEWYDDTETLVSNASDVQTSTNAANSDLSDSRLVLQKIVDSYDNEKQYSCVLTDAFGRQQKKTVSLMVTEPTTTVETTTIQAHPAIMVFPTSKVITLMLGEERDLTCMATGVPSPKVTWTKDGEQITDGIARKEISITASSYSMAGEYKCTASNREGEETESVRIDVQGKPKITGSETLTNRTEKYTLKPEDNQATLVCRAESIPLPEILWVADEKDIKDFEIATDLVRAGDSVTSYLNISSRHFKGESSVSKITCTATNVHGTDYKSFSMSISPLHSSKIGIIVGIVFALLILILAIALLYYCLVRRRQKETISDPEKGGILACATCCGGSVKSKELREEEDVATGEHVKEVSEDGSEEEKQRLTETDEGNVENGENQQVEGDKAETKDEDEDKKDKPKKSKRKISFPTSCCGGRTTTITKKGEIQEEDKVENCDAKLAGEDKDSCKGDTLPKITEEDNGKK